MKSNAATGSVYVPRGTVRAAPKHPSQQVPAIASKSNSRAEALAPRSDTAAGSSNIQGEGINWSFLTLATAVFSYRSIKWELDTHFLSFRHICFILLWFLGKN